MHGWLYILECADGSYYTGCTGDIQRRFLEHQNGLGSNHTKKRLPVRLVYSEAYPLMQQSLAREKQIQGWSRKKKEALINGRFEQLPELAECRNISHYRKKGHRP
jgi:putative endonuclease